MSTSAKPTLRICFVDMNAGVKNEAMRCLGAVHTRFLGMVAEQNPTLEVELVTVSPRDKGEAIPRDHDIYVCSGGPGAPQDGDGTEWAKDFRGLVESVLTQDRAAAPRSLFAICYSYELVVHQLGLATLHHRKHKRFGVMPIYTTEAGQKHPLLSDFHDRIFAFEHRNWDTLDPNHARLAELNGAELARESRVGKNDKGESMLAFHLGESLEATLFHPEADRDGIRAWISKPEQEAAFREAYGDVTHDRMIRTVENPERIDRAHITVVPGFLRRRFNALAPFRGWALLPEPKNTEGV